MADHLRVPKRATSSRILLSSSSVHFLTVRRFLGFFVGEGFAEFDFPAGTAAAGPAPAPAPAPAARARGARQSDVPTTGGFGCADGRFPLLGTL